jgi:hypothetical protein
MHRVWDVNRPTVPEVMPRINAYMAVPGNEMGGSLHIVLCDGNVGDDSVGFCLKWAVERGDVEGAALAKILLTMSLTQRGKVANLMEYPPREISDA